MLSTNATRSTGILVLFTSILVNGRICVGRLALSTSTRLYTLQRLMSFDNKKWRDFLVKIRKVQDQLKDAGIKSEFLNKQEASLYVDRFFAMNFLKLLSGKDVLLV